MLKKAYYRTRTAIKQAYESNKALPESNPIIVYSMRKVGSTTLTSTMREAGHFVYKHHCLNPQFNAELRHALSRTGFKPQHWLADGANFSKRLEKWRARRENGNAEKRLKIFTFVKDPLAIALSDYFMQLFEFMPQVVAARKLDTVEGLKHHFQIVLQTALEHNSADPATKFLGKLAAMPNVWFERELKATTGIDVLDTPFPIEIGYGVYHGHDSDVVLIRTDKLSDVALDAITTLTGNRPTALVEKNVRAATPQGELYRSLLDTLSLPPTLVREFYRQPWLNHFYSEVETEDMIAKWSRSR
ncbi:MAG: putative capsular polysaccharide synthesis family protein [Thiobacillus sp.]